MNENELLKMITPRIEKIILKDYVKPMMLKIKNELPPYKFSKICLPKFLGIDKSVALEFLVKIFENHGYKVETNFNETRKLVDIIIIPNGTKLSDYNIK